MENKSLLLLTSGQERKTRETVTGEIVTLPPELAGFQKFYTLLRSSTLEAVGLAESLLKNDPDLPDPRSNPDAHKNLAMRKYGVHLLVSEHTHLPDYLGFYSLARFRLFLESVPKFYSPGYQPPDLKRYFESHDPLEPVLYSAVTLTQQAIRVTTLRSIFRHFPAKELAAMEVYPENIVIEEIYREPLRRIIPKIDGFRYEMLSYLVHWQKPKEIIIDMKPTNLA